MKVNKLLIGALIILIAGLVFWTIKLPSKTQPQQTTILPTSASTANNVTTTIGIGSSAPNFSVTTLDKETFQLSDKKGKIVILFGMAGWCGTCIPEGKALTQIKKEYADKGVEVIGVAFTKGDNEDFLKEYKKIGGIDIPVSLDTDNVAQKYNLVRLETTYIINKEGKIVYKDDRTTSYEEYKNELDKIL